MKTTFLHIFFVLTFASFCFGQSVKIVPKKVIYQRPNVDIKDDPLGMKEFSITYPIIFGVNRRKIESYLNYEKIFDFKIEKEIRAEKGIQKIAYKVLFNSKNILSIRLSLDAYTFSDLHYNRFITINTKTAKIIEPAEVFKNLRVLAAKCKKSRLKAIADVKKGYSPDDYGTLFDNVDFTPEELKGFTVSNKGVTFHYPYSFARTAIMFEPKSDYFFKWEELKPFIKPAGLLGTFIR